ncbi:MAG: BamA/TamA family outer membrane protein [candidate division WOR-3 bacterium]
MNSWLITIFVISSTLYIKNFHVEGVKSLSKQEIRDITRIKRGDKYYPPLVNLAVNNLIEALKEKGFFEASLSELKVEEKDSIITVKVKIKEGPHYKISSLRLSWIGSDSLLKKKIFDILTIPTGTPYNSSDIVSNEEKAYEFFRNFGYLKSVINREVVPDTSNKTCTISYEIDPGMRYRIIGVSINGLQTVRRTIVEREIKFKAGDYVSSSTIIDAIRRIYATGLFARVYHAYNFHGDSLVSIDFFMEERKPRYVRFQGGITPISFFNFTHETGHKNVFGNNQQITAKMENSIALPASFEKFYIEILYSEPYFLSSPLKFNLKGFGGFSKSDSASFGGLETYLSYFWMEKSRSLIGVQWRRFFQTNHNEGITNKALFSSILDKRDDVLFPQKGLLLQVDFQSAGSFLGGNYNFYKYYVSLALYNKIWKPYGVLATRVNTGQIIPLKGSEIPLIEKFRIGGDGSLRGFRYNQFSSNSLLLLNCEIRSKIKKRYGFSFLFDLYPEYRGKIWTSFGIGFRYFLPVGNLRIDWAYNPSRHGERGYFGNVYINLGEMF